MATSSWISPPMLEDDSKYKDWKEELNIWQALTELKTDKQGPAVFMILRESERISFGIRGRRD